MLQYSNVLEDRVLKGIDLARGRIITHPEFSESVRTERLKSLEQDSLSHSVGLELAEEGTRRSYQKSKVLETRKRLTNAWKLLRSEYNGFFDPDLIMRVARTVEPDALSIEEMASGAAYRLGNVRVSTSDFSECGSVPPVNGVKVAEEMDYLLGRLNDQSIHAVERAIQGHKQIARIHPFYDGNGRLARLIQNIVLKHNGYAPIVINEGERDFYQGLLRCALKGFVERKSGDIFTSPTHDERTFANYLASKENQVLRDLQKELKTHRHHEIVLGTKQKGIRMGAKKVVSKLLRHLDRDGGFHRITMDGNTLSVVGDVSADQLEAVLTGYSALKKFDVTTKVD